MGERLRAHDWAGTPLGPIEGWPQVLRTAVDICLGSAFASFVWWGPELVQIYNDAAIGMQRAKHPDALGRPAREVWSELWERIRPMIDGVLGSGEPFLGQDVPLLPDRGGAPEEAFFTFSYSALRDADGRIAGLLAIAIETTEKVRALAAREDHERRLREVAGVAGLSSDFRALFEFSPTPFLVVAPPDFTCIAVNDAYLHATSTKREQLIGRRLFEVFPDNPADPGASGARNLRASLERVLATGRADVMAIQRYDIPRGGDPENGFEERWWSPVNSPVPGPGGEVVAIILRVEDVTEIVRFRTGEEEQDQLARDQQATVQRLREATAALAHTEAALLESERMRAEAALRESEGKFRAIADLVPDLLWSSDASGAATWYNRRWTEYTGLSVEQSVGAGWLLAVHPEDRDGIARYFRGALESGTGFRHEFRLRGTDGEYRWFLLEARPARDHAGEIAQWFGALTNVHEQRLALQAAEQASEAKSQFLAVMSHELRTPLTGVISYSDLLEAELFGPVTDQQRDALARIKANAWHLVSIIDEVLTLSRAEAGRVEVRLEEVDVAEVTREVGRILESEAEQRGLSLHLRSADDPIRLRTDVGKVRQILLNLVGNAVKYTERGEIWVEIDHSSPEWVRIHIRDTGPGIAPEDHERIFQPFTQVDASHTRTAGGTGLGLSISRRLARILDGDISLQSTPGEGSTFTLLLPRWPEETQ